MLSLARGITMRQALGTEMGSQPQGLYPNPSPPPSPVLFRSKPFSDDANSPGTAEQDQGPAQEWLPIAPSRVLPLGAAGMLRFAR